MFITSFITDFIQPEVNDNNEVTSIHYFVQFLSYSHLVNKNNFREYVMQIGVYWMCDLWDFSLNWNFCHISHNLTSNFHDKSLGVLEDEPYTYPYIHIHKFQIVENNSKNLTVKNIWLTNKSYIIFDLWLPAQPKVLFQNSNNITETLLRGPIRSGLPWHCF